MNQKTPCAKLRTPRVKQSIHHHREKKVLTRLYSNNRERWSREDSQKYFNLLLAYRP